MGTAVPPAASTRGRGLARLHPALPAPCGGGSAWPGRPGSGDPASRCRGKGMRVPSGGSGVSATRDVPPPRGGNPLPSEEHRRIALRKASFTCRGGGEAALEALFFFFPLKRKEGAIDRSADCVKSFVFRITCTEEASLEGARYVISWHVSS